MTALSLPQEHGHCADFHPSGAVVAIGTHSGKSVQIIFCSTKYAHAHFTEGLCDMVFVLVTRTEVIPDHKTFVWTERAFVISTKEVILFDC